MYAPWCGTAVSKHVPARAIQLKACRPCERSKEQAPNCAANPSLHATQALAKRRPPQDAQKQTPASASSIVPELHSMHHVWGLLQQTIRKEQSIHTLATGCLGIPAAQHMFQCDASCAAAAAGPGQNSRLRTTTSDEHVQRAVSCAVPGNMSVSTRKCCAPACGLALQAQWPQAARGGVECLRAPT
jgi:hypothetical protein